MLKLIVDSVTAVADQTIEMIEKLNTNSNLTYTDNEIIVNKPGIYQINASFVTTATSGEVDIQIFNNGTPIPEAIGKESFSTGNTIHTIVITDAERFLYIPVNEKAKLTFVCSAAATISSGEVIITKIG